MGRTVTDFLLEKRIEWKFIPARAPWFGGFYERLIGLTKSAMKKVLGSAYITFQELQTLIVQIEAKINDRPLTYCSANSAELSTLTPSQFSVGYRVMGLPNKLNSSDDFKQDPRTTKRLN